MIKFVHIVFSVLFISRKEFSTTHFQSIRILIHYLHYGSFFSLIKDPNSSKGTKQPDNDLYVIPYSFGLGLLCIPFFSNGAV